MIEYDDVGEVPGAIAAKIALPHSKVVVATGDGAFLMRATVVPTAVEQNLPIVWIVMDNQSLQIERETMLRLYGRESMCDYSILACTPPANARLAEL